MIEIVAGLVVSFLVPMAVCLYYAIACEDSACTSESLMTRYVISAKKEWRILLASCSACLATFAVSQCVYHADCFWTYRWQIAAGIMVPAAAIDFEKRIIPNSLLLIGLVQTVAAIGVQTILNVQYTLPILGNAAFGMLAGGGVFFLAALLVKNGVGAGDIKLFLWLGLTLALRGVYNVMLYSMLISAVCAIILVVFKKKSTKDELPLAPFALVGVMLSILFGV